MESAIHELLWQSCDVKRCCSTRTVLPTGGDIWRIATALAVPPESFVRAVPADPFDEAGAILAPTWGPFRIALARRAVKGRSSTCSFLMILGEDVTRCGLGPLRPLPCQVFPAIDSSGIVHVGSHGCSCRTWTLGDLDRSRVAALLQREQEERQRDRALIQAWNARPATGATEAGWSFADLCGYLFAASAPPAPPRDNLR